MTGNFSVVKFLRVITYLILFLIIVIYGSFYGFAAYQGVSASFWQHFKMAEVNIDEMGIPTVEANNWENLIEAQGFVVASERLWQMDLMRRKSQGKLSEWFGKATLEIDKIKRMEGWQSTADDAYKKLPKQDKMYCDLYAKGVNKFIDEFDAKWGMEYVILAEKPEPWHCRDSISIVMLMGEELSSSMKREVNQAYWKSKLSEKWFSFLFPTEHPWNKPFFGKNSGKKLAFPSKNEWLSKGELPKEFDKESAFYRSLSVGSNSWAWRGNEKAYLESDPHLGFSVPALWYAMRLRVSAKEWVVGVSLPGIPGITLGMNPHLAWTFTNTGEDVDDLYLEKIDFQKKTYSRIAHGKVENIPLGSAPFKVKIRGEKDFDGTRFFTDKGPIVKVPELDDKWFSRSWVVLKSENLGLPVVDMIRSKNWQEFNKSVDRLKVPSQNVSFVNRNGEIGYRLSGVGINKTKSGLFPSDSIEDKWISYEPDNTRYRQLIHNDKKRHLMPTANQRIWVDNIGHHFSDDGRQERIKDVLSKEEKVSYEPINKMQHDTFSQFYCLLTKWISSKASPATSEEEKFVDKLKNWKCDSVDDSRAFAIAIDADKLLSNLVLNKIKKDLVDDSSHNVKYQSLMHRVWVMRLLETPNSFKIFGYEDKKVATWLMKALINNGESYMHPYRNRWQSQHPFVGRVPIVGDLFKVGEFPQWGYKMVVKVESAKFGSSTRIIWDLMSPEKSTWVFPVGQSGHVGSSHYKSFQWLWHNNQPLSVFNKEYSWN